MSNGKVTTEGALALTEVQDKTLTAVLNLIIPPSDDGRMPGATEYDILGYIQDAARDLIPTLAEELDQLEGVAQAQAGTTVHLARRGGGAWVDNPDSRKPTALHGQARRTHRVMLLPARPRALAHRHGGPRAVSERLRRRSGRSVIARSSSSPWPSVSGRRRRLRRICLRVNACVRVGGGVA